MTSLPLNADVVFVPVTVHKRDVFSETISGHAKGHEDQKLVLRSLLGVPLWARFLSRYLARRESRGLQAVSGIEGVPQLIRADRKGLLRTWSDGLPLNIAKPNDAEWYRDAHRLLREMRMRGVTHNDLAKPQNWLITPDGRAAVIDFQLASTHKKRGRLYRIMAYEDLRHLAKMKRLFAPHLLTPKERKIIERRSLPSRVWRTTGKRLYNFVTRQLMNWSDGEGSENRVKTDAPPIIEALAHLENVRGVGLSSFPRPSSGGGLYVFVESNLSAQEIMNALEGKAYDLLQVVSTLPKDTNGNVREDVLELVAMNRMDELDALLTTEPELKTVCKDLVAGRKNLTDRRFKNL